MKKYRTPNGNIVEESVLRKEYGNRFDKLVSDGTFTVYTEDKKASGTLYTTPNGNQVAESELKETYGDRFDTLVAEGTLKKKDAGTVSVAEVESPFDYQRQVPQTSSMPANMRVKPSVNGTANTSQSSSVLGSVSGLVEKGNIDLFKQPSVHNTETGGESTVYSMSIGTDEGEVLISRVTPDGQLLSEKEAIAYYKKTGKHLGIFKDVQSADAYAKQLQENYAKGAYDSSKSFLDLDVESQYNTNFGQKNEALDANIGSILHDLKKDNESLLEYNNRRSAQIDADIERATNSLKALTAPVTALPTYRSEEDTKQRLADIEKYKRQIASAQEYKGKLRNSIAVEAIKHVAPQVADFTKEFNAGNFAREILKVADPEMEAKFQDAQANGGILPPTTAANLERLGLDVAKNYLSQQEQTEGVKRRLKLIDEMDNSFDQRNIQVTAQRVREKLGVYFYNHGKSGIFGYSTSNIEKAINDPETDLTDNERKVALEYVLPLERKMGLSTDIPGSGFWRSGKNSIERSLLGTGGTIAGLLGERTDAMRAYEKLNAEIAQGRFRAPGDSPSMNAEFAQLKAKEKAGELTPEDAARKDELEKLVDVRSWGATLRDGIGDLTGQVVQMALLTKGVGSIGKLATAFGEGGGLLTGGMTTTAIGTVLSNETAGLFINSFLQTYDNYRSQALEIMPGEKNIANRQWYAVAMAAMEGFSERIFNDVKVLNAFSKGMAPSVADITTRLLSNEITASVAKNEFRSAFVKYARSFGKGYVKSTYEESFEEGIVDVADGVAQSLFGGQPFDIAATGEQAVKTFLTTALYSPLVAGMAAHGDAKTHATENAFYKSALVDMALNPAAYLQTVENLELNKTITQDEANEKIKIIKSANSYLKDIPSSFVTVKKGEGDGRLVEVQLDYPQTASYLVQRLHEGIIADKLEKDSKSDPIVAAQGEAAIRRSQEIRQGIVDGTIGVTPNMIPVTDDEKLARKLGIAHINDVDPDDLVGTQYAPPAVEKLGKLIKTVNGIDIHEVNNGAYYELYKPDGTVWSRTQRLTDVDRLANEFDPKEFERRKEAAKHEEKPIRTPEGTAKPIEEPSNEDKIAEINGRRQRQLDSIEQMNDTKDELEGKWTTLELEKTDGHNLIDKNFISDSKEEVIEKIHEKYNAELAELKKPTANEQKVATPIEALKDVESTTKALEQFRWDNPNIEKATELAPNVYGNFEALAEDYHKFKKDGTHPEFVKAVEEALSPKANEQKTATPIEDKKADIEKRRQEALDGIKLYQDPTGKDPRYKVGIFDEKGKGHELWNVVHEKTKEEAINKINEKYDAELAALEKPKANEQKTATPIEDKTKPFAPEGYETWLDPDKTEHTNSEGVVFKIGDEVKSDGESLGKITGFDNGYVFTEKNNEATDKRPINTEVLTKVEEKQKANEQTTQPAAKPKVRVTGEQQRELGSSREVKTPKVKEPKAPKERSQRQEKINSLRDRVDSYNDMRGNDRNKSAALNELRLDAEELGLTVDYGKGHAILRYEGGGKVQRRSAVTNAKLATNFDESKYSKTTIDAVNRVVADPSLLIGMALRGEDGYRFSEAQRESAVQSIKDGKPTEGAKALYEFFEHAENGQILLEDLTTGNEILVPIAEYFAAMENVQPAIDDDIDAINSQLGEEAFNDTFDEVFDDNTNLKNEQQKLPAERDNPAGKAEQAAEGRAEQDKENVGDKSSSADANQKAEKAADSEVKKLSDKLKAKLGSKQPDPVQQELSDPQPYTSKHLPEVSQAFQVMEVRPYTEASDNQFRPDQQLKFNQGESFEPVTIVADPEMIELIAIGAKIKKQMSTGEDQKIPRERQRALEAKIGITAMQANTRARELARENRDTKDEVIIVLGTKPQAFQIRSATVLPDQVVIDFIREELNNKSDEADIKQALIDNGYADAAAQELINDTKDERQITLGVIGQIGQWLGKLFGGKHNVFIAKDSNSLLQKVNELTALGDKEILFQILDDVDVFDSNDEKSAKEFITKVFNTVENEADAKSAYRKLARKFHPDKNNTAKATEIFKHLNNENARFAKNGRSATAGNYSGFYQEAKQKSYDSAFWAAREKEIREKRAKREKAEKEYRRKVDEFDAAYQRRRDAQEKAFDAAQAASRKEGEDLQAAYNKTRDNLKGDAYYDNVKVHRAAQDKLYEQRRSMSDEYFAKRSADQTKHYAERQKMTDAYYKTQYMHSGVAYRAVNAVFETRDGKPIGFNYNSDKVARERFDFSKMKKIGEGSDRVVFDMGDGRVLKVAKTARGLEQNINEGRYDLVGEGIIPEVFERGLNYVVAEKVEQARTKAQLDLEVSIQGDGDYENKPPIVTTIRKMLAEFSKFRNDDVRKYSKKLYDVMAKYGFSYALNYDDFYIEDFSAAGNWGLKDGKPIHLDGGTFSGYTTITKDYLGKKNLSDPEFREIYNKSRALKKEYGDTDKYTMFQGKLTNEQQAALDQLTAAQNEYQSAKRAFDAKRKALDKEVAADQENLFGERPATQKAEAANQLFDERISGSARDKAMKPLIERLKKAENAVNAWQKKYNDVSGQGTTQMGMFQVEAYHGSPHEFDRFSTSKIGTGEGHQAFGYGLYFTSIKEIADNYAKTIASYRSNSESIAQYVANSHPQRYGATYTQELVDQIQRMPVAEQIALIEESFNRKIERIKKDKPDFYSNDFAQHLIETQKSLRTQLIMGARQSRPITYKVTLHHGKTPQQYTWLQWDKAVPDEILDKIISLLPEGRSKEAMKESAGYHRMFKKAIVDKDGGGYGIFDDGGENITGERFRTEEMAETKLKQYREDLTGAHIYTRLVKMFESLHSKEVEAYNEKVREERDFIISLGHGIPTAKQKIEYEKIQAEVAELRAKLPASMTFQQGKAYAMIQDEQKNASDLLLQAGVDGVRYPAESIARGKTSETARGFNYVVFDENAITITERVAFMKAPQGDILGFTSNGKIYLNGERLNPETPIHEAGHIWTEWAVDNATDLYDRGRELIKNSKYLAGVKANPFYQSEANKLPASEREKYFEHEALATAIGDKGAQFISDAKKKGFAAWAAELWDRIGKALGFKDILPDELANLTLDEFAERAAIDILKADVTPRIPDQSNDIQKLARDIRADRITFNEAIVGKDEKFADALRKEISGTTRLSLDEDAFRQARRQERDAGFSKQDVIANLSSAKKITKKMQAIIDEVFLENVDNENALKELQEAMKEIAVGKKPKKVLQRLSVSSVSSLVKALWGHWNHVPVTNKQLEAISDYIMDIIDINDIEDYIKTLAYNNMSDVVQLLRAKAIIELQKQGSNKRAEKLTLDMADDAVLAGRQTQSLRKAYEILLAKGGAKIKAAFARRFAEKVNEVANKKTSRLLEALAGKEDQITKLNQQLHEQAQKSPGLLKRLQNILDKICNIRRKK